MTTFFQLSLLTLTFGMIAMRGQNLEAISITAMANPEAMIVANTPQPVVREIPENTKWKKAYRLSVFALGAATAADMASSFKFSHDGQREGNAFLASSNGAYGMKGAMLEAGAVGASLLVQHFLVKKYPNLRVPLAISNFAIAGFQAFNVRHNVNY
jgi:hypothetical protein